MKLILDLGNLWDMLSALGTIGAVILSLWLARRTERPNLYIYYCMDDDSETDKTTHIFEILNIGQVPTTLLYEGLSLYKRIIFSKQVEFDGVLEWTYNEKNLPTHYSSTLRPGESVYLEVEDNIMKKAIQQLVGRRQQGKVYFYIVDHLNKSHFVAVSIQDILEENRRSAMAKRPKISTTINEIADYWTNKVCESELSVDWSEARERCWRCARKTKLERCHIIPHSRGGTDRPSNFVLLCKRCHLENPNVVDPEIMWDWLKAYKAFLYDTFWIVQGLEEYQKIYGDSFLDQCVANGVIDRKKIEGLVALKMRGSSHHFGEPHFNKATVAGILRMIYKEIIKNPSD